MAGYTRYDYDVLVIGAGGAGLRAAIEASAAGVKVGLICKSLLGKAHTVMAEGGIAAALANVDDRDNWKVHFSDTMRGGQYVNNWRMAELHAKEAPARVRELEAWGAVFDRTPDGRILQRNFGGHRYPRLAHVGDRTGLELIRTLQDHAIHSGATVHMECTIVDLLTDGNGRVIGAFGYERERGPVPPLLREGGRPRHRRHRPRVSHHEQQLGGHRRRPRARLSRRRGSDRHGVRAVPSDRDGVAAERPGHPRDRGRPRRRRRAAQQQRRALHVRGHPRELQEPDRRQRGRRLAVHAGRQDRPPAARAAHPRPRRPLHRPGDQGGARQPARRRVPRHLVDQGEAAERRGAHQAQAAEHVPPVQAAGRHRHHEGADGDRPDDALHHGRRARERRDADVVGRGVVRRRRVRVRDQRRQPARRQFAVGHRRVREARGRVRRDLREGAHAGRAERGAGRDVLARSAGAVRSRRRRREARTRSCTTCSRRCRTSSGSCGRSRRCARR